MIERERLVLIGHPVSQSLSPLMHNAALEAKGSSLRYEALDVEPQDLAATLSALARMKSAGNFTVPHKRAAMEMMRVVSDSAHSAGAVNTFWGDGYGALDADNTDVEGFSAAIIDLLGETPSNIRIALLGGGGAASAVLTAIDQWPGVTVSVHARDLARGMSLRMRHKAVVRVCSMRDPCLEEATLVVNATSVGMVDDHHPVELERISSRAAILDLVYGKVEETSFVRAARERGHLAQDGLRMLLHQGVASFTRWFGERPDPDVMWRALSQATGRD
jgi:shikimate dehydrogenase